ncbi:hypothetical protein Tco_0180634, partial [Tanacetum coccineum]
MLVAGLILLKTSFSSPTLKVIFLLKTSILEWAIDKNGRQRIKRTSSSSAEVLQSSWKRDCFKKYAPVLCARYGVWTTSDTAYLRKSALIVEVNLTWSQGFVSVELGRLPNPLSCKTLLICPISNSAINLVSDSSRLGLLSGYEEFPLLLSWAWIATSPLEVSVPLVLEDVPLCHFWEYSAISWMAILASAAVLE